METRKNWARGEECKLINNSTKSQLKAAPEKAELFGLSECSGLQPWAKAEQFHWKGTGILQS